MATCGAPAPAGDGRRGCHGPLAALMLLSLAVVAGCREGDTSAAPSASPAQGVHHYTVRGEVVRLPDPARRGDELLVRHEAIEGFVDRDGKVARMAPMVMPFRLEPSALAQGLAVGDKIEIRFAVDWSGPSFRVERVERLAAATPLRFDEPTSPSVEKAPPSR